MKSTDRIGRLLTRCVESFQLDLRDLSVLTEAASGAYLHTPILAAMAGASKVYAIAADSRYGKKEHIREKTLEAAALWGVSDRLEVVFQKSDAVVSACDIITNSGFVRPIDRKMIAAMRGTAVIPLMWEPWEFREEDLDLSACREHGILVMGTDESRSPPSFYSHNAYLALKLLFELGLEGYKTSTLFFGGNGGFAHIYRDFKRMGIEICWVGDSEEADLSYEELPEHFLKFGSQYDALILTEHHNPIRLLGRDGLLPYDDICRVNPALRIGIIAGNIDADGLRRSGLHFFPEVVRPFGYLSYQAYQLGPLPVLELYAAGLKVGQVMARGRLQGMSLDDVKRFAERDAAAIPI